MWFSLLSQISEQVVQVATPIIIMYPKASMLYSIKTKRLMTETGIQLWLESLVSSRFELSAFTAFAGLSFFLSFFFATKYLLAFSVPISIRAQLLSTTEMKMSF